MNYSIRAFSLGAATVSLINVGDVYLKLSDIMAVPKNEWQPEYAPIFEQSDYFPSQCIHIALPGASVLVDANDFARSTPPGSPYAPPAGYQPLPDLLTQLRKLGIEPEDITHLVITHAHFDHYAGITREQNGTYQPTFPRARCFLGKPDWDYPEMQESLRDATSEDSLTWSVVQRAGLLELVEGDRDLTASVRMIAAPGESPGHQIVRIASQGQVLYCLGDLFHHPIEVEHPSWMAEWDDSATTIASRNALMEAALSEDALLIATHIASIGHLERSNGRCRWVPKG